MKRFFYFPLLLLLCALAGCNTAEDVNHFTYFTPTQPNGRLLYADQTRDTLVVVSTDTWTFSLTEVDGVTPVTWMTSPRMETAIPEGQYAITSVPLRIEPNNTGLTRKGLAMVASTCAEIGKVAQPIVQLPLHNVMGTNLLPYGMDTNAPYYAVSTELAKYILTVRTYSDFSTLDLSAGTEAIAEMEISSPDQGTYQETSKHVVNLTAPATYTFTLTLHPNQTGSLRTYIFSLSSQGVVTPIHFSQKSVG